MSLQQCPYVLIPPDNLHVFHKSVAERSKIVFRFKGWKFIILFQEWPFKHFHAKFDKADPYLKTLHLTSQSIYSLLSYKKIRRTFRFVSRNATNASVTFRPVRVVSGSWSIIFTANHICERKMTFKSQSRHTTGGPIHTSRIEGRTLFKRGDTLQRELDRWWWIKVSKCPTLILYTGMGQICAGRRFAGRWYLIDNEKLAGRY